MLLMPVTVAVKNKVAINTSAIENPAWFFVCLIFRNMMLILPPVS
jgi:hypothetical protein